MPATAVNELRHLILAAQRHGSRMLADGLRAAGLTPAQAEVLDVLARHQPLTLVELGRLLVCETGSPSRLVDALVQRGLVAREPGSTDRRVIQLRLTAPGQRLLSAGAMDTSDVDAFITARLSAGEVNELARLLRKLLHDTPGGRALRERYGAPAATPARRRRGSAPARG